MAVNSEKQVKSSRRKLLVIAIAAGLITIATGFYIISRYLPLFPSSAPIASPTLPVIRPVTALGRLEPRGEAVHLSSPNSLEGTRILQVPVKEGDKVRAGRVIAILDSRDRLQAALKAAQAQLHAAQAQLAQVKAGAKIGEINAQEATIQRMRAELQGNVATQVATVKSAEAELRNAQTEYERYERLYQDGAISASTADSKCLGVETA